MSSIHERLDAESEAHDRISRYLGPFVTLTEQAISLYEAAGHAIAGHLRPGSAAKVGLILTCRLANDLRVCSLSAQLGYGVQALSLGATIVEIVGALAYVGDSDSRADQWAQHKDIKHTYPRWVPEGIDAALTSLGICSPEAKTNWQEAYTFLCMAKHANPRISMLTGLRVDSDGYYYGFGPDPSAFGTYLSAEALYYAIGFGMSGICVALSHCSDNNLRTQLRSEAGRVLEARHGLESWLSKWREAANTESSLGVVSQRHMAAIAEELQLEAERLDRKTEDLRQETEHIRQETQRVRREPRLQ